MPNDSIRKIKRGEVIKVFLVSFFGASKINFSSLISFELLFLKVAELKRMNVFR